MDALLLALLLGAALDQGDRSQRLVHALGPAMLAPVGLVILAGAILSALLGFGLAPFLRGPAGLLFFGLALVFGGAGLLMPASGAAAPDSSRPAALLGQLLLHRLGNGSSFLFVGIVALTGNVWATALGGALGGLAALLPPLLAGAAYEKALPLRIVRPALGAILLIAGAGCAVSAFGLV